MKKFIKRWTIIIPLILSFCVLLTVAFAEKTTEDMVTSQLSVGNKFLKELKYDEAVIEFTKAIRIDSKNSAGYLGLSQAYVGNGQSELAIELLKEFGEKYKDEEILENLADIYIGAQQYEYANNIILELIKKTDEDKYYEKQIEIVKKIRERETPISIADSHTVFIQENALQGMGKNLFGQLGTKENVGNPDFENVTPIQITFNAQPKSVATSTGSSYVVDKDGNLWATGLNLAAQLGNGSTIQNVTEFTKVENLKNISAITAGSTYAVALDSEGNVWAMGNNEFGQMGIDIKIASQPVCIPTLNNTITVHTATKYALFQNANGELYISGTASSNTYSSEEYLKPHRVAKNIIFSSASDTGYAYIDADGLLTFYGYEQLSVDSAFATEENSYDNTKYRFNDDRIIQLEASNDAIALLTAEGEVVLLTEKINNFVFPKAKRIFVGNGEIGIVGTDDKLKLYGYKTGEVEELM